MRVTFLTAANSKVSLTKTFKKDGTKSSYPNVKRFDSHEVTLPSDPLKALEVLEKSSKEYAAKGAAMLKGETSPGAVLKNESRKGFVDRIKMTNHIVLDIDGLVLPNINPSTMTLDNNAIKFLAGLVVNQLPVEFQQISYVAMASSSLGVKPTINIHLHFLSSTPVRPKQLKEWLKQTNLDIQGLRDSCTLNATYKALSYTLDPCLADNSRMIYIGTPIFENKSENPIADDDRVVLVQKQIHELDMSALVSGVDPEVVKTRTMEHIKKVLEAKGLKYEKPKTTTMKVRDEEIDVVTNPPRMNLDFSYINGDFFYFNINGGDSNGYYVLRHNPRIVQNFKGEDAFLLEEACKDTYEWVLEQIRTQRKESNDVNNAHAFRVMHDLNLDTYWKVVLDPKEDRVVDMYQSKKDSLEDWMLDNGEQMPKIIESWEIKFDPTSTTSINESGRTLNLYHEPLIQRQYEQYKGEATMGEASLLEDVCPLVYRIIYHMTGSDSSSYEHFINWLAYAIKTRTKTQTAWLFHGTTGTGKGLFYKRILQPIIGPAYCAMKKTEEFQDNFNGYMETSLFIAVDEFRVGDTKQAKATENWLKNQITEEQGTIRLMRTNPKENVPLFTNFLFYSNDNDALMIAADDRRFNIAPRQEVPIKVAIPELSEEELSNEIIHDELPKLVGFLKAFKYDINRVRTPMRNRAKTVLKEAAADIYTNLVDFFKRGDLEPFLDIIQDKPVTEFERTMQAVLRPEVLDWVAQSKTGKKIMVLEADLRAIMQFFSGRELNRGAFKTIYSRRGLTIERKQVKGKRVQGFGVAWDLDPRVKEQILINADEMNLKRMKNNGVITDGYFNEILEIKHDQEMQDKETA